MDQTLAIYIVFQSLILGIALIAGGKLENRPLAFYFVYLFFSSTFLLLSHGAVWSNLQDNEPIGIIYELIALCRSAIVFYFLYSILEKPMPKSLRWLWSFPILNLAANYAFKIMDPNFYKASFYENWYLNFPLYTKILFTILLIWQVKVFKKEITENSVSKKHSQLIKLYWGKYFVYFYLALSSISLLYLLFTLTNGRLYTISSPLFIYSANNYNVIYHTFTAVFLLVFGYLALRNPSVFNINPSNPSTGPHFEQKIAEIVLPEAEKNFQKKIEFTDEQKKQYDLVLNKLMENDTVYLDPELSLSKLAKLSAIPSRQLSQFIQTTFHKNYKEYINYYRTKHAQKLLTSKHSSRFTMYAIALDSGFNSESSFYKIFKEQTELTPKQYHDKFRESISV